ncbi:hypothetical protein, partial [Enterobacter roggenkampii]
LNYYQYQLKGISFLPRHQGGAYPQMPYEEITEKQYVSMMSSYKELDLRSVIGGEEAKAARFCSNDTCEI